MLGHGSTYFRYRFIIDMQAVVISQPCAIVRKNNFKNTLKIL